MSKRIYLIGYMGVGKSTWGKKWASSSKLAFLDLDSRLEEIFNMSISDYIAQYGELAFRKAERQALKDTAGFEGIISVGGGTPCFYDNMVEMNRLGMTVYLHASIGFLSHRLVDSFRAGKERPLLLGVPIDEYPEFIGKHLFERQPYYRLAKLIIQVEKVDVLEALSGIQIK
ncbi:MAG TPA: shikimate kinase [Cryomorphaceae bacterium]|nr:MAG: hypothetical protein ABR98_05860 [Cryomorphaceae bacterium BACL7 MAG-120910-bin2]KRO83667.1 MAG: hypothetical protein ABR87_04395 [Cryomorphaceae bacterium BACL7 MAG-121220-bin83]NQW26112.1 shikimate kinase [Cryomorphaceae bacterium]HAB31033.1 shikimate kinase [Cryomorphaceae bacterium]